MLVPGGFGSRGWEGKILACRVAREDEIPYLGICLGMHVAVSEFARHVCGLDGANSTEMDPETPYPVIDLLPEQKEVEDLGGTMRLGAQAVELAEGTRTREVYGDEPVISERHRHRYEVNNAYRQQLVDGGLVVSGTFQEGRLVEIVELPDHPWFVASQFHPEFKSRPTRPAPLFREFVAAALDRARTRARRPASKSPRAIDAAPTETKTRHAGHDGRAGDVAELERSCRPCASASATCRAACRVRRISSHSSAAALVAGDVGHAQRRAAPRGCSRAAAQAAWLTATYLPSSSATKHGDRPCSMASPSREVWISGSETPIDSKVEQVQMQVCNR